MKNKKQIFLWACVLFLAPVISVAAEPVSWYLNINSPGLPIITKDSTIPELIRYFWSLGIYATAIIGVLSFVFAGIQMMLAGAKPEYVSQAKDRMRGSALGIVLAMAGYLLLLTVNPTLTEPYVQPISSTPGVYIVSADGKKEMPCPPSVGDKSTLPEEFKQGYIKYKCNDPAKDPILLVWLYVNKNLDPAKGAATVEMKCDDAPQLFTNSDSFKIAFRTPGVYYYATENCSGYRSNVNINSGQLPDEFKGKAKSIQFVNNPDNNIIYGAILHEKEDYTTGGKCQAPIISPWNPMYKTLCQKINISAKSASIFNVNPKGETSGDGVEFYSGAYGWDTGTTTGTFPYMGNFKITKDYFDLTKQGSPFTYFKATNMKFRYTPPPPADVLSQIDTFDKTSKEGGSLRIQGNYVVALYESIPAPASPGQGATPADGYCQVFTNSIVDLNGTQYLSGDNKPVGTAYMIATK